MRRHSSNHFLLEGKKNSLTPREPVATNSAKTDTTRNLSQDGIFHESNRRNSLTSLSLKNRPVSNRDRPASRKASINLSGSDGRVGRSGVAFAASDRRDKATIEAPTGMSVDGGSSLRKSVSFSGEMMNGYDSRRYRDEVFDEEEEEQELMHLMQEELSKNDDDDEDRSERSNREIPRLRLTASPLSSGFSGPPKSPREAEWFLHPRHLGGGEAPGKVASSSGAVAYTSGAVAGRRTRDSGVIGAKIALEREAKTSDFSRGTSLANGSGGEDVFNLRDPSLNCLARRHFPLTLGTSFMVGSSSSSSLSMSDQRQRSASQKPPQSTPSSPPEPTFSGSTPHMARLEARRHLRSEDLTSVKAAPRRTAFQNGGVGGAEVSRSEDLHLMRVQAPETASSSTVLLTSPYQVDLAKLRMERLRIEEERLLEMKRIEELERIRGPSDAWYELKDGQFHYEARKNNEMIRNQNLLGATDEYKNHLIKASMRFAAPSAQNGR